MIFATNVVPFSLEVKSQLSFCYIEKSLVVKNKPNVNIIPEGMDDEWL